MDLDFACVVLFDLGWFGLAGAGWWSLTSGEVAWPELVWLG